MKKQIFAFQFLLVILISTAFSQVDYSATAGKKTLLIMHPTVGTLSAITKLIDEGIFPVNDIQLKGVYHFRENNDYTESAKYIQEHNLSVILEEVDEKLDASILFRENPCSPVFEKLFNESSGVIFFGGPDIPPTVYGEKTSILTGIYDPYRHYFEASFLFHLLGGSQDKTYIPLLEKKPNYMITGFCLGMQTINVATGGTMIQDIPFEIYKKYNVEDILNLPEENQHRNYANDTEDSLSLFWGKIHPVKIMDNSWLVRDKLIIKGQNPAVVSSHHQALEKTGLNIRIVATSMDGKIIEAIDHLKYPHVFGFQFHPEVPDIYNYNNSYQCKPTEHGSSLRVMIEKGKGYEFHLSLLKKFAEILNYSSDK